MERKQIYIAFEQGAQLKQLADRQHTTVSALIRNAIDVYLEDQSFPELARPEDHPLWGIIGMIKSQDVPSDGSIAHDRDLYGREF